MFTRCVKGDSQRTASRPGYTGNINPCPTRKGSDNMTDCALSNATTGFLIKVVLEMMTREKNVFEPLVEFVRSNFLRMNIANKLLLGFSSLLILLVIVSAFALTNLNRLNQLNESIVQTDIPVILASDEMIDLVLAEELYIRRYMVFRTDDVLDVFVARKSDFTVQLDRIRGVPEPREFPVAEVDSLHVEYTALLIEGAKSTDTPSTTMPENYEDDIGRLQEKLIDRIKQMGLEARLDQDEKTNLTAQIGSVAFEAAAVLCIIGLFLSLITALIITRNISGAIRELNFATSRIAEGEFGYKPVINNTDELGDLAAAFSAMAERLQHLEKMNLDTSPLTRLPGGTTIENIMKQRIDARAQIAFCLVDLDNFKAYNDHYGYTKGNDLIKHTAQIITQAVDKLGNKDDFVGHIGGDDYVVITTPEVSGDICQAVIEEFDASIPDFYTDADRKRGHISGKNRQGAEVLFPLATISIAVVTNERRELNNVQFGELAAEMKSKAKSKTGSVYCVDQRQAQTEDY